jgi:hypothetical protein
MRPVRFLVFLSSGLKEVPAIIVSQVAARIFKDGQEIPLFQAGSRRTW